MIIHLYGDRESSELTNDPTTPMLINAAGNRQQAAQTPSEANTAPAVASFTLP